MKTTFFLPIFMLFAYPFYAQIILDINDLPDVGDVQVSVKVDSAQAVILQPGNSGNNVLWDFSNLIPCCGTIESSRDTMLWENHTSTANSAAFPLSNIVNKGKCFTYHSHETHLDETQCYYNHYIKDDTGLLYYGLEDPVNVTFNNYYNIFPLLTYGDSLQNTATIHIPISDDSLRIYHIDYSSIADAWGIIITPNTTVEVIRIYTAETIFDTLYVNGVAQQIYNYAGNYYFRWYTKNLGFPVLEIARGMQSQQPPFFQKVKYAGQLAATTENLDSSYITLFENVKVYPNPFDNDITIVPPFSRSSELTIYNVMGEIIYSANISSQHIVKTENWNVGIYFYQLRQGQENITTGKIMKR